jgi:hypothetical protein
VTDTLPEWLWYRYSDSPEYWDDLSENAQEYWKDEAIAVRNAVHRGGLRKKTK